MRAKPRRPMRYAIAMLAVAGAVFAMQTPVIGQGLGIILFFAVLFGAWYGGLGPGLLATFVICAIATVIGLTAGTQFTPPAIANLVMFVLGGVLISLLVEALHSARRQAEASERWLLAVLTSIGDAVIATDEQGRVTFLNPVAEDLTGWSPEEAADRALPEVFRIESEETHETVEDPASRVLREGRVVGLANHTVLKARDGTVRPIADSAAPIRDDREAVQGVVLVFRDMTEKHEAAAALKASEGRFRLMADSAPVLIWIAGTDGLRNYFNRSWLEFTGRTIDQERGDGWVEGVHPEDLDRCLRTYRAAFEASRPFEMDYRLRRHDGEYRWVLDQGLPLSGADGGFAGFIGSAFDITDRKLAEEGLKLADRRKDEFLAMLAHELRNPLSAIGAAAQGLDQPGADGPADWSRQVIDRQVRHLSRMIDDLLDVSRITQGKIQLRTQRVDAASILAHAVEVIRPQALERRRHLEFAAHDTPLWVEGDPTRLEQVIVNLLGNALKYTEPGGRVELMAGLEEGEFVARVRDDGIGIAPELQPHVFDLFVQADRSLARSEGGLGIGLTLVRELVRLHGGRVSVASDGPGLGSEFSVRLPTASAPVEASLPLGPAAESGGRTGASAVRVLVVDDNQDTARATARLLARRGYEVRTVHDGPSAVEAAREYRPEAVLLDIGLPGMDGYGVAERLREDPGSSDALLIAVTGYARDRDRRRSLEVGIDHHLVKPVDFDILFSLLALGRGVQSVPSGR